MYGWRARIGLILPMDNAVMEPELYSLPNLNGISFYSVRLTTTKREEMPEEGIRLSCVFNELGVDVVVYACAETSFLKGIDGNQYIGQKISECTRLPAFTAMSAMVEATRFLNLKSVSLVAPYTPERTATMVSFLARSGIAVCGAESRDFSIGSTDVREWYECNKQPPATAYQMAKKSYQEQADGIIISATNFRTFEIIRPLEDDIGKPVVTTNQAILWAALKRLGIRANIPYLGLLHTI